MTTLVVLSVVDIVLLIAGLAFYLFVVGGQLARVATNLEECADLVRTIDRRVVDIKATLQQAAANTADTALIETTADGVDGVLAEGLEHHLFLGRVLGQVRS